MSLIIPATRNSTDGSDQILIRPLNVADIPTIVSLVNRPNAYPAALVTALPTLLTLVESTTLYAEPFFICGLFVNGSLDGVIGGFQAKSPSATDKQSWVRCLLVAPRTDAEVSSNSYGRNRTLLHDYMFSAIVANGEVGDAVYWWQMPTGMDYSANTQLQANKSWSMTVVAEGAGTTDPWLYEYVIKYVRQTYTDALSVVRWQRTG